MRIESNERCNFQENTTRKNNPNEIIFIEGMPFRLVLMFV